MLSISNASSRDMPLVAVFVSASHLSQKNQATVQRYILFFVGPIFNFDRPYNSSRGTPN